jgi:hypothetical protein
LSQAHVASILLDIQQTGNASKAVQDLATAYANMQPAAAQGGRAMAQALGGVFDAARRASGGLNEAVERSRELLMLGQAQAQQRESMAYRQHQQMQALAQAPLAARQSYSMQARQERKGMEFEQEQQLRALQFEQAMAQAQAAQQQATPGSPGGGYYQGYYGMRQKIAQAPGRAVDAAVGPEMGSKVGAAAAAFTASYQATTSALGKAATAMDILGNSTTTAAQKQDALFANFVPMGDTILRFRDAVMGVTDSLRRTEIGHQDRMLQQSRGSYLESVVNREQAQATTHGHYAQAYARAEVPAAPNADRSTFQGDIQYSQQARLFPLQGNLARAQAESDAAKADVEASRSRLEQLKSDAAAASTKQDNAIIKMMEERDKENGPRAGATRGATGRPSSWYTMGIAGLAVGANLTGLGKIPGVNKAIGGLASLSDEAWRDKPARAAANVAGVEATAAVLQAEKLVQEEIVRLKERGLSAAEKESAVRKASIAIDRAQLGFLQEKEQRLGSQAVRLAGMGPAGRAVGSAYARMMQNMKPEAIANLPSSIIGQAQYYAPEFVRKRLEQAGEKLGGFVAEDKRRGILEMGKLSDVREEIGKKAMAVEVKLNFDRAELNRQIVEAVREALAGLVASIKAETAAQVWGQFEGRQINQNH